MPLPESDQTVQPNPHYGVGCFRRSIRLTGEAGVVHGELEDTQHAMRCTLRHDGERVMAIETHLSRLPMDTCASAGDPIQSLVGWSIDTPLLTLYSQGQPRRNCTHLFDLVSLAVTHALRGEVVRRYDVMVPDETSEPVVATIAREGEQVHAWKVFQGQILAPELLAGGSLFGGFTRRVSGLYQGDELEAALVLQKGFVVAQARRFDMEALAGTQGIFQPLAEAICHSYTPGVIEQATRLGGSTRDFSDTPEKLLSFL